MYYYLTLKIHTISKCLICIKCIYEIYDDHIIYQNETDLSKNIIISNNTINLFVETLKNNINNQINDYILEILTTNIFL